MALVRVGVSATYTNDSEIEEGICSQDPYFEVSEKEMQINKNADFFRPFPPFLSPIPQASAWSLTNGKYFYEAHLSEA